ncbi:MAG: 4Fe-4S binding protein [Clostridia bacterium]|nr:4Fe-4S binding protein [Clostridia bacterium]
MAQNLKPVAPPKNNVLEKWKRNPNWEPEGVKDYLNFEEQYPKKQQRQLRSWVRTVIQVLFFLFLPSAYSAAFNGVKYIFTQVGKGAAIQWTPFVAILVVLLAYTIVFGRFFCGYACAFGSLGDWLFALQKYIAKKTGKKPKALPRDTAKALSGVKYVVLTAIIVLCFTGLYAKLTGWNPWDAFSMLHARNFALGKHIAAVVILVVLMVGMAFEERFFCKFLCPMGAVFSLMPTLPFFSLHRTRKDCLTGCSACTKTCPADLDLPESGTLSVRGDCFQCGKCVGNCPKTNIHCGVSDRAAGGGKRSLRGNELWFVLLRAAILLGLFIWLGV